MIPLRKASNTVKFKNITHSKQEQQPEQPTGAQTTHLPDLENFEHFDM